MSLVSKSSIPHVNLRQGVRFHFLVQVFAALIFSVGASAVALLVYSYYAEINGINVEVGCEGPGLPFAMLSNLLFILFLRDQISKTA